MSKVRRAPERIASTSDYALKSGGSSSCARVGVRSLGRLALCISLYVSLQLGSAGCSGTKGTQGGSTPSARATGRLSIDTIPVLDIPGTGPNGHPQIGRLGEATRLSSGLVVLTDESDASLRTFDASGRLVRQTGRRGDGPGEYRSLSWLRQCAVDTLFVWDPRQARVTVLDSTGRFVRQFRVPSRTANLRCSPLGTFALVMTPGGLTLPSARSPVLTSLLVVINAQGDSIGSLGEVPLGRNRPLATVSQFAVAGDRLYFGTGDSATVSVYAFDGQLLGALRVGRAGRIPTRTHYERAIDKLVAVMASASERESVKQFMLRIPMPDHLPPYTDFHVDPTGGLWVVVSAPGDGVTEIHAFTKEGDRLGEVRLPFEMTVFEVGGGYLLGAYQQPDGEQHVALFGLRRRG